MDLLVVCSRVAYRAVGGKKKVILATWWRDVIVISQSTLLTMAKYFKTERLVPCLECCDAPVAQLCCPSFTRRSSPDALASLQEHVLALVAAVGLAALGGGIGCDGRAMRK